MKHPSLCRDGVRIVAAYLCVFAAYGFALAFSTWTAPAFKAYIRLALLMLAQYVPLLVAYAFMQAQNIRFSDFFCQDVPAWRQVCAGVLLALITSLLFVALPMLAGFRVADDSFDTWANQAWKIAYTLLGVAVGEELVFRGFFYETLKRSRFGVTGAVIGSSVLFGVTHILNGSVAQVICTTLIGLFWCYAREKCKSCTTLSLIVAHGLYGAAIPMLVRFMTKIM